MAGCGDRSMGLAMFFPAKMAGQAVSPVPNMKSCLDGYCRWRPFPPALQGEAKGRGQVGNYSPNRLFGDDHVKLLGASFHVHAERVHVHCGCF